MQNVPKIVSERLRASAPVAEHPDADVLTAFAERSLTDRERSTILGHLALCRDCRDVVALALPATEAAQPVVRPERSGWFIWPALRWGFAAVGLVVIASFGVIEYQKSATKSSDVAKVAEPREEIASHVQAPPPAAPAPSSEPKQNESYRKQAVATTADSLTAVPPSGAAERISEPKHSGQALKAPAAPSSSASNNAFHGQASGAVGGLVNHRQFAGGPNMPAQWQQQQQRPSTSPRTPQVSTPVAAQPSAPAAKVPSVSETVTVEANAPTLQTETNEIQTAQDQASQGASQNSNQSQAASDQTSALAIDDSADLVSKAKPAPAPTLRASVAKSKTPHWSISSTGTLQRSFDQGKTWQSVDVTANLASAGQVNGFVASQTIALAKEKDNSADKKVPSAPVSAPVSTPVFRAVAVSGSDVWAGGSNAALYHSLDAGNHWTQIVPTSAGAALNGDVISLEFSDARQGRVRTSTGETWMTSDDGQSWQKQ